MAYTPVVMSASGVTKLTLAAGCRPGRPDRLLGWLVKADADGRIPAQYLAMKAGAIGDDIPVCSSGVLYDQDAPYTAGADEYLSATAGAHTETKPAISATLTIVQRIGVALTTDTITFDLRRTGPLFLRATAAVDPASALTDAIADLAVTVTGRAGR
jgi:hypothetical protein